MRIRAGTSGYSYTEWRGKFYPEKAKPAEMLGLYAARLETVEINNTFYRMPREQVLVDWGAQVPDGFSFVLKAPRRITHQMQLRDAADAVSRLLGTASVLGSKLGPILFQLPPFFKKDLPRLADFLALLPAGVRAAFEFRHETWNDDEVYAALRSKDAALVVSDADAADPAIHPTASHGYLRLRRESYDDADLARWAERIAAAGWGEAWVFFKHEDEAAAPRWAERFADLARGG